MASLKSTGKLAQLEHLFICHIIDSRHLKCPKIKSNLDLKFSPRIPTTTLKGMVWIQGGISYHRALQINISMGGWCYKVDSMWAMIGSKSKISIFGGKKALAFGKHGQLEDAIQPRWKSKKLKLEHTVMQSLMHKSPFRDWHNSVWNGCNV